MTIQPLEPFKLPMQATNLIEASAGTGKTYTIATLYLRLLLQIGEGALDEALTVDQILVVTFTNMATDELKGRIRERIRQTKLALEAVENGQDPQSFNDSFLKEIIEYVDDRQIAITRLAIAEQDFDLAAIFTIHSFCSQMLKRYAFNSAVPFEMTKLEGAEKELFYRRFAREVWRELFYGEGIEVASFVKNTAKIESPDEFLKILDKFVGGNNLNSPDENMSYEEFLTAIKNYSQTENNLISTFKQYWRDQQDELYSYLEKSQKNISKFNNVDSAFKKAKNWAEGDDVTLADKFDKYFVKEFFDTKKGAAPVPNPIYKTASLFLEQFNELQCNLLKLKALLLYFFNQRLTQKLDQFKSTHEEKTDDDLLHLMEKALQGSQGEELALRIGSQYPFAMIDEFQDTDPQQYFIFQRIYLSKLTAVKGFLMIGDPKQSIYKFRGADIFSYLNASKSCDNCFTLDYNWRSHPSLVDGVNALFNFDKNPFLYENITFQKVFAAKSAMNFTRNGVAEPAWRVYWQEEQTKEAMAKTCALSIRQYLDEAQKGQALLNDTPLEASNIAVLLRNQSEAKLVQEALSELGIQSVYLSDKTNLFETLIAKDMLWILKACLNPLKEQQLLNALTCHTLGLTAQEIEQLKQDEARWETTVQRFLNYKQLWQKQGVLPMLHLFIQQENLTERCFLQPRGERKLTDFLHLAELLQEGSAKKDSPISLVHWFERFVKSPKEAQQSELRLESDRALVKLVTVHKSKGLAYDIVWLPFIGFGLDLSKSKKTTKTMMTYYDKTLQKVQWDWQNQQQESIIQENCAEEMRLLYVALTRAKYQIAMSLPPYYQKKHGWSAFYHALSQGVLGLKELDSKEQIPLAGVITTWQEKIANGQLVDSLAQDLLEPTEPFIATDEIEPLQVSEFSQKIDRRWQSSSFSQWVNYHQNALPRESEKNDIINSKFSADNDYDEVKNTTHFQTNEDDDHLFASTLPSGRHIGKALHSFFENLDFQSSIDVNDQHFLRLIKVLDIQEDDEERISQLVEWLDGILKTPLIPNSTLSLCQLNNHQRLNEMEFFFKVNEDFCLQDLNQLLKENGIAELNIQDFHGLMHGFIDLVFCFEGKYYLLDYKSNLLGNTLQDYDQSSLQKTMIESHYDWQYLIYCVALHRYLSQRLADYDYAQHFGGVIYPFLRGITGQPCHGVFFTCPDSDFIHQLEGIFNA